MSFPNRQRMFWAEELLLLGIMLARRGDYLKAIVEYDAALSHHPQCADALVARGAAKANLKRYDEAVNDFDAALAINPADANAIRYRLKTLEQKRLTQRMVFVPTSETLRNSTTPSLGDFCLDWSDEKERLTKYAS